MEKISKNFLWMAAANISGSVFAIIIFIYLARVLGPVSLGYLSLVQTFAFYLATLIDLGLSTYGAREVAKNKARVSGYVSEIVSFRVVVAIVVYVSFVAMVLLSPHSNLMKLLMAESCLALFVYALATEWAFQGMEMMRMVFISFSVTSILQMGLIYAFVKKPEDLAAVPILYVVAAIPVITVFLRRLGFKPSLKELSLANIKIYLSSSLIIWAISAFAQVYTSLDIALLGFFRRAEEVGYFTIARKVVGAITLFFIFLANAALPNLSANFGKDLGRFDRVTKRFFAIAVISIIVVFAPMMLFSKGLITLTVGREYLPANLPLNIMMAALVLVLFNLPFSTALIAASLEKEVLKQTAFCAFFSVCSNFIIMPKYGMIGASATFFFTELIALLWILHIYNRKVTQKGKEVYRW